MKKFYTTFLLLGMALSMSASFHLTVEKWVADDLVSINITKDTTIIVTEFEYDEDLEEATMGVEGAMYSDESENVTVTITRSATGIFDQFCAAGNCIPGNSELTQELSFTIGSLPAMRRWFTHYSVYDAGTETIQYAFNDGTNPTLTLTVKYSYLSYFPRKFVLEHFTGDGCGYCPGGMNGITSYTLNQNPSAIWLSHHYGYNSDEYSITESSSVGKMLGVSGAPSVAVNRTKQYGSAIPFQPHILPEIAIKDSTLAEASVLINHNYNAETRQLDVTVSGQVANPEAEAYLLTVLIKENNLIGTQADYQYSWKTEPWKEYMHARVVRDFISSTAFGDTVYIANKAYSKSFTYTIKEGWKAEDCCVVAYITPLNKKPIINAEQAPLVAGTTGGEEYFPYGITENKAPNNADKLSFDSVTINKPATDKLEVVLYSKKAVRSGTYGSLKSMLVLDFNTTEEVLPFGTFSIQSDNALNTLTAGYAIHKTCSFAGSRFHYIIGKEFDKGNIVVCHTWHLNSGEMIVNPDGTMSVSGYFYNGKPFTMTSAVPVVTALDNLLAPQSQATKLLRDGHIIIRKNGIEYDMLGNRL